MAHNYNGSLTGISPRDDVVVPVTDDGDAAAAATFNPGYQKLSDLLQFLMKQAALFAVENGFSVEQAFLATSALLLNNSATQALTKIGGGGLQFVNAVGEVDVVAASGSDINLRATGGAAFAIKGDGTLNGNGARFSGLANPSADTDADTQGARNAAMSADLVAFRSAGALSNSCGLATLGASEADVPNLSVSLTVRGDRPVLLTLVPDGIDAAYWWIQSVDSGGTFTGFAQAYLKLLRDATALGMVTVAGTTNSSGSTLPAAMTWIDFPSAGAHTWKLRGWYQSGTGSSLAGCRLFARELL